MAEHLPRPCSLCQDKQQRIEALEKVVKKLDKGANALNWVSHELGLRRKIEDIERKAELNHRAKVQAEERMERMRLELSHQNGALQARRQDIKRKQVIIDQYRTKLAQLHGNPIIRLIDKWITRREK